MTKMRLLCVCTLALWGAAACGDDGPGVAGPDGGGVCTPDRPVWDADIEPIVERHCGACHGTEPQFGAPFTLLDYDALVAEGEGGRTVDRVVARLMDHTMPPVGSPHPPDSEMAALAQWASCGASTPDPAGGLVVSAPPVRAPTEAPAGLEHFDFTAQNFAVGPDVLDHYQCFVMDFPATEARLIQRFEIVIDDARVLHHAVLLRDTERAAPDTPFTCFDMPRGSDYLYAWAPGQDAVQFPEGGLRMEPGERLILQIHYNNGTHAEGVSDSSGVRIFHGPTGGTEYGMVAVGPLGFTVPARSRRDVTGQCGWASESRIFAGLPHMHEIGAGFEQHVVHADGREDPIVSLDGWSFETQLFYEMPVSLVPGDKLVTTCKYDNPLDHDVSNGFGTGDEMCFNFMYVTPPPAGRYCDELVGGIATMDYTPGECAPSPPLADTPAGEGTLGLAPEPAPAGGTITDGDYILAGADVYLDSLETPIGPIDPAGSATASQGQLRIQAGRMQGDVLVQFSAAFEAGSTYEDAIPVTWAGNYSVEGDEIVLSADCPADATGMVRQPYTATADSLTLSFTQRGPSGAVTTTRMRFTRVP